MSRQNAEVALAPWGETERALVVLHCGHGVGYAELAEAFSLREGAVRMRMSRAVEKTKDALMASDGVLAEESAPSRRGFGAPPAAARAPAPARARAIPNAQPVVVRALHEEVSRELRARLAALAAAA